MEFKFEKIVRPIKLADYAEEFGEAVVEVWVNPPRSTWVKVFELSNQHMALAKELKESSKNDTEMDQKAHLDELKTKSREIYAWYSEIWSQGGEESHVPLEEVEKISSNETDPAFYVWLTAKTIDLISDWRKGIKKG